MPNPSLKRQYRITRIETIDTAAIPAGPTTGEGSPASTKIQVTGSPVLTPEELTVAASSPTGAGGAFPAVQWIFDDAPAASSFFNVDETVEASVTFTIVPPAG